MSGGLKFRKRRCTAGDTAVTALHRPRCNFQHARALLTLLEAITPTFGLALVSVQTDISRTSPRRLGTRGIQRFVYRNPAHQAQCRQATSVTCTVRKMDDR
jgi:hypothetical protein